MVTIRCEHCRLKYSVAEDLLGKTARCSKCHKQFRIAEDVSYWRDAMADVANRYPDPPDPADSAAQSGIAATKNDSAAS